MYRYQDNSFCENQVRMPQLQVHQAKKRESGFDPVMFRVSPTCVVVQNNKSKTRMKENSGNNYISIEICYLLYVVHTELSFQML